LPETRFSSIESDDISARASVKAPLSRETAAFLTTCSVARSSAPAIAPANTAVACAISSLTSDSAAMRSR